MSTVGHAPDFTQLAELDRELVHRETIDAGSAELRGGSRVGRGEARTMNPPHLLTIAKPHDPKHRRDAGALRGRGAQLIGRPSTVLY